MLVGNDFLSHCPHLEIDNGALSLMLNNYIDLLPEWGGYLTNKEKIHPERFEQFLYHIAGFEEEHFKRRGYEENEPGWQLSSDNEEDEEDFYGVSFFYIHNLLFLTILFISNPILDAQTFFGGVATPEAALPANRKLDVNTSDVHKSFNRRPSGAARSYRDFYYETKLGWSPDKVDRNETLKNRRAQVRDYLEGLHWVLHYYHNGCPSWDWFFPHLYSPLCTDIVNIREFYEDETESETDEEGFASFKFEQTEPFPSLGQLLSVLPPQSANLLPPGLGELMTNPSSPIAEYYPPEFETDANGKRQPWEAVVQIPFIEGNKLLDVVTKVIDSEGEDMLTVAERKRNERGESKCFVPQRENGATEANFPPLVETPRRRGGGGGGGR